MSTITSEFLPQSGPVGASSPRVAAQQRSSRRRRSPLWAWLPAKPDGWILLIAFGLFGAAVGATGYLAIEEIAEAALAIGMPSPTDTTALRAGSPTLTDSAASLASVPPADRTATANPAPNEVTPVGAPGPDVGPAVAEPVPSTPGRENRAPRRMAQTPRAASTRAANAEAIVAPDAGAQPSALPIASAALAPEPPVPDRWETMSVALASCARESLLADVVCAERVRHQYCEGFWGQVPQCRAATRPGTSR